MLCVRDRVLPVPVGRRGVHTVQASCSSRRRLPGRVKCGTDFHLCRNAMDKGDLECIANSAAYFG